MAQQALVLKYLSVISKPLGFEITLIYTNHTWERKTHTKDKYSGPRQDSNLQFQKASDRAVTGIGCIFVCFRRNNEQFNSAETNEIKLNV